MTVSQSLKGTKCFSVIILMQFIEQSKRIVKNGQFFWPHIWMYFNQLRLCFNCVKTQSLYVISEEKFLNSVNSVLFLSWVSSISHYYMSVYWKLYCENWDRFRKLGPNREKNVFALLAVIYWLIWRKQIYFELKHIRRYWWALIIYHSSLQGTIGVPGKFKWPNRSLVFLA